MGLIVKDLRSGHMGIDRYSKTYKETFQRGPDSAGGIGFQCSYMYTGEKTIKYISFFLVPYNSVDDIVTDDNTGEAEKGGRVTGFLKPNTWGHCTFETIWYNPTITKLQMTKSVLEFDDGTSEIITADQIQFTSTEEEMIELGKKAISKIKGFFNKK